MPPKRKASSSSATKTKKAKATEEEQASESQSSSSRSTSGGTVSSDAEATIKPITKCTAKPNLVITSWNVNGLRAWIKNGGIKALQKLAPEPDIFCVQETKCSEQDLPPEAKKIGDYHSYFQSSTSKQGYAGVALYSKEKPLDVTFGLGIKKHDDEGRLVTAEFEEFYLVSAYVPNSGQKLERLKYRHKEWDVDFLDYIKKLDKKKPVIYTGDLNVAHQEIDLRNPKTNRNKTPGFCDDERNDFTDLLNEGFTDSYRSLYPDKESAYTFWSYRGNARAKDVGWRLDYFIVSDRIAPRVCDNVIHSKAMGSDHCPISLLVQAAVVVRGALVLQTDEIDRPGRVDYFTVTLF